MIGIRPSTCRVLAFAALIALTGCRSDQEEEPPVITVSNSDGYASVHLRGSGPFPEKISAVTETVDGLRFGGLVAEGEGYHLKAMAAALPQARTYKVVIDTTMPLLLRGEITGPDGSVAKSTRAIPAGHSEVVLDANTIGLQDG